MKKQTYTQDQQVDIISEVLLTLAEENLCTKPKKMKAYEQFFDAAVKDIIINCFGITNQDVVDSLMDKTKEAAIKKHKIRFMDNIENLPEEVRSLVQEAMKDGADVQIIVQKYSKDE